MNYQIEGAFFHLSSEQIQYVPGRPVHLTTQPTSNYPSITAPYLIRHAVGKIAAQLPVVTTSSAPLTHKV